MNSTFKVSKKSSYDFPGLAGWKIPAKKILSTLFFPKNRRLKQPGEKNRGLINFRIYYTTFFEHPGVELIFFTILTECEVRKKTFLETRFTARTILHSGNDSYNLLRRRATKLGFYGVKLCAFVATSKSSPHRRAHEGYGFPMERTFFFLRFYHEGKPLYIYIYLVTRGTRVQSLRKWNLLFLRKIYAIWKICLDLLLMFMKLLCLVLTSRRRRKQWPPLGVKLRHRWWLARCSGAMDSCDRTDRSSVK